MEKKGRHGYVILQQDVPSHNELAFTVCALILLLTTSLALLLGKHQRELQQGLATEKQVPVGLSISLH